MTREEVFANFGKPFKVTYLHGGILGSFDTIRAITTDDWIIGDFIVAHCEDCRLKGEQPQHLIKKKSNDRDNETDKA